MQRNGKMLLQDTVNKTPVCFLVPPTTHLIATPCSPVYALNTKEHTLFIKGQRKATFFVCFVLYSIVLSASEKKNIDKGMTSDISEECNIH